MKVNMKKKKFFKELTISRKILLGLFISNNLWKFYFKIANFIKRRTEFKPFG